MGCHTWFYKKVNPQPTDEDKINQFKHWSQLYLNRLQNAVKNGGFKYSHSDKLEWYPYENKNDVLSAIERLTWMLENADIYKNFEENYKNDLYGETKESELFSSVMCWKAPLDNDSKNSYSNYDEVDELTINYNGLYYSIVRRYHDCFRYHEYGTYLTSKEETFKLIEDNHIEITRDARKKIEEFWSLYPDGLISLG